MAAAGWRLLILCAFHESLTCYDVASRLLARLTTRRHIHRTSASLTNLRPRVLRERFDTHDSLLFSEITTFFSESVKRV